MSTVTKGEFPATTGPGLPEGKSRRKPQGRKPWVASSVGRLAAGVARGKQPARPVPCVSMSVRFSSGCCLRRPARGPGQLPSQGVASTAQGPGATPVGRAFTQQEERPQQLERSYLRQHMCARDSRNPRLRVRRDNDGRAEQIRIASFNFSLIRKLTTEERKTKSG
jgi:hypothetical protein